MHRTKKTSKGKRKTLKRENVIALDPLRVQWVRATIATIKDRISGQASIQRETEYSDTYRDSLAEKLPCSEAKRKFPFKVSEERLPPSCKPKLEEEGEAEGEPEGPSPASAKRKEEETMPPSEKKKEGEPPLDDHEGKGAGKEGEEARTPSSEKRKEGALAEPTKGEPGGGQALAKEPGAPGGKGAVAEGKGAVAEGKGAVAEGKRADASTQYGPEEPVKFRDCKTPVDMSVKKVRSCLQPCSKDTGVKVTSCPAAGPPCCCPSPCMCSFIADYLKTLEKRIMFACSVSKRVPNAREMQRRVKPTFSAPSHLSLYDTPKMRRKHPKCDDLCKSCMKACLRNERKFEVRTYPLGRKCPSRRGSYDRPFRKPSSARVSRRPSYDRFSQRTPHDLTGPHRRASRKSLRHHVSEKKLHERSLENISVEHARRKSPQDARRARRINFVGIPEKAKLEPRARSSKSPARMHVPDMSLYMPPATWFSRPHDHGVRPFNLEDAKYFKPSTKFPYPPDVEEIIKAQSAKDRKRHHAS